MVQLRRSSLLLVLALGDVVFSLSNFSVLEVVNGLTPASANARLRLGRTGRMRVDQWLEAKRRQAEWSEGYLTTRRRGGRSTSSDSKDDRTPQGSDVEESLNLSDSGEDKSASKMDRNREGKKLRHDKYMPVSTEERKGWLKWHRKCPPCPEDAKQKWRDPSISWICGAYQRARRSFKSECMMRYRNCQDGTMFVKIHDHRCKDDNTGRFGTHFFYEYNVVLTEDSSILHKDESTDEADSYDEVRRSLKRRAGVSWKPHARASFSPRRRVRAFANGTANSVAKNPGSASENLTTTILTDVVNISVRSSGDTGKVRSGNVSSNVTIASDPSKVVRDGATRINRTALITKSSTIITITTRAPSGDLGKAINAVSNFGLLLANIAAHHSNSAVGHTKLTVQHSKPQLNGGNFTINHHIQRTSANPSATTQSLDVLHSPS